MRRILTLFLLLVTIGTTAQITHLSFDDALSLGMERSPAVVASEYAEKAAHRERQAAIGLFMPKVSLKGAYTHLDKDIKIDFNPMISSFSPVLGEGLAMLGVDLSYPLQHRNTAFLGGDVVLPIFAGGKIWIANKAAKIGEKRTAEQSRQVRGALLVEIVERYFGVELARQGVAIRKEAVDVVGQHLHDVALLEKEGMAVASERLYAEYRLAEAERDLQRAELQLETAQKALLTSLGGYKRVLPSTPIEVYRVRELARMNLKLQRANLFPEVVAMGGMVLCNHQLSPLVPRMAVGIGLNFNIFDGLRKEYKTSAACLQLRRVEALEQKAEQDILLLVESLYNRLQSVLATVSAVERSERFAEEFLRAKRNAFREGMATATDVVDATLNLSRTRLERTQTAYEFDIALARLLEASGMADEFPQYLHSKTAKSLF